VLGFTSKSGDIIGDLVFVACCMVFVHLQSFLLLIALLSFALININGKNLPVYNQLQEQQSYSSNTAKVKIIATL